jgi:hypothetical protein
MSISALNIRNRSGLITRDQPQIVVAEPSWYYLSVRQSFRRAGQFWSTNDC